MPSTDRRAHRWRWGPSSRPCRCRAKNRRRRYARQPFTRDQIANIARIQLRGLEQRLAKLEIKLDVDDAALAHVAEAGFDPVYGARPLKRAIQQQIENPLAKEILSGKYAAGDTVRVKMSGSGLTFVKS